MWWVVVLCAALLAGVPLVATQSIATEGSLIQDPGGAVYRSGVDLVSLNVVVADGQQQAIRHLPRDAFDVYEDNVPQVVTYFDTESVPIDLAVIIDTSASMLSRMDALHAAAARFLDLIRPGDRVTVISAGGRVRVLQPLDADAVDAAAAIRGASAGGDTALYDAVYLGLHELQRQQSPGAVRRQVLTVFSDGEDTTSLIDFDGVMEVARRTGVTAYTMLLTGETRPARDADLDRWSLAMFAMKDLARESGGRAFFPTGMAQVPDIYGVIANDILAQYTLGYVSTNTARDGGLRHIRVRMKGVAGSARTRTAYYAAGPGRHLR